MAASQVAKTATTPAASATPTLNLGLITTNYSATQDGEAALTKPQITKALEGATTSLLMGLLQNLGFDGGAEGVLFTRRDLPKFIVNFQLASSIHSGDKVTFATQLTDAIHAALDANVQLYKSLMADSKSDSRASASNALRPAFANG